MSIFGKIKYNSPVILTYALICVFSLIIGEFTKGASTRLMFCVYRFPLDDALGYVRLFTHVIGHINFNHLFGNFMIILLIGPMLEEKYGSLNLLIMIIFTAGITGIFQVLFFNTALLGASGVAFMLIILSSFANISKGKIPLTLILVLFIYLGQEVISGAVADDNVSHITHILGGVCGAVFGFFINNRGTNSTGRDEGTVLQE